MPRATLWSLANWRLLFVLCRHNLVQQLFSSFGVPSVVDFGAALSELWKPKLHTATTIVCSKIGSFDMHNLVEATFLIIGSLSFILTTAESRILFDTVQSLIGQKPIPWEVIAWNNTEFGACLSFNAAIIKRTWQLEELKFIERWGIVV